MDSFIYHIDYEDSRLLKVDFLVVLIFFVVFQHPRLPQVREDDLCISLSGRAPNHNSLYQMPLTEMTELKRKIGVLSEHVHILINNPSQCVLAIFVTNNDHSLQLCIDYREKNRHTIQNQYPLSRSLVFLTNQEELNGSIRLT